MLVLAWDGHVPVRLTLEFQKHTPHECGVAVVSLAGRAFEKLHRPLPVARMERPTRSNASYTTTRRRALRISHGLASRHGCRQPGGPAAYDRNRFRFAHAASVHSLPAVIYARIRPTDQPEVECRRHRRLVGTASWR